MQISPYLKEWIKQDLNSKCCYKYIRKNFAEHEAFFEAQMQLAENCDDEEFYLITPRQLYRIVKGGVTGGMSCKDFYHAYYEDAFEMWKLRCDFILDIASLPKQHNTWTYYLGDECSLPSADDREENFQDIVWYLETNYPQWKSARDISTQLDIKISNVIDILNDMEGVEVNKKFISKLYRKRRAV